MKFSRGKIRALPGPVLRQEGRERNSVPFRNKRIIRGTPSRAARPAASVLSLDGVPAPLEVPDV